MGAVIGFSLTNMLSTDCPVEEKLGCIEDFYQACSCRFFNEVVTDFTQKNPDDHRLLLSIQEISPAINPNLHLEEIHRMDRGKWNREGVMRQYSDQPPPDFFSHWGMVPHHLSYADWALLDSVNVFIPSSPFAGNDHVEVIQLELFKNPLRIGYIEQGIYRLETIKREAQRGSKRGYDELLRIFKVAKKHHLLVCISG